MIAHPASKLMLNINNKDTKTTQHFFSNTKSKNSAYFQELSGQYILQKDIDFLDFQTIALNSLTPIVNKVVKHTLKIYHQSFPFIDDILVFRKLTENFPEKKIHNLHRGGINNLVLMFFPKPVQPLKHLKHQD